MSKYQATKAPRLGAHYIYTAPRMIEDVIDETLNDQTDYAWMEKARRLQARRWRKLRNQTA